MSYQSKKREKSKKSQTLSAERRSRKKSKDPIHDGSAGGFEIFTTCDRLWPKMGHGLWHRTVTWGCFDSTAAYAALPLSMTGVEKFKKVTGSEGIRPSVRKNYPPGARE